MSYWAHREPDFCRYGLMILPLPVVVESAHLIPDTVGGGKLILFVQLPLTSKCQKLSEVFHDLHVSRIGWTKRLLISFLIGRDGLSYV